MNSKETATLSKKRYAIARCIVYIQLLVFILVLFLPTINFSSHSEEFGMEAKAGISVFQFLTGNTATQIHINGTKSTEGDSTLLGSLLENYSVDLPKELFGEELLMGFRLGALFIGLIVGLVSSLANRANSKTLVRDEKRSTRAHLADQMYITNVYLGLPKILNFIQTFIFGATFFTYFILFVITQASNSSYPGRFEWDFNAAYPIFVLILMIALINGVIVYIVCAKDISAIRTGGLRFEESYEFPTISSDIKVISSLLAKDTSSAMNTEQTKIETLERYKTLLDQGILTEEEFNHKKNEILNEKNEQS